MTELEKLREEFAPMLATARGGVRAFASQLGVTDRGFVDAVERAVGDISIQEAYDALYQQALRERTALLQEIRAEPDPPTR